MDKQAEAHPSIFDRGETGRLNSLSVVLSQEVDRFNRLTKQMITSLKELQKAIKGLVVMSDELEQMLLSMLDSKVCSADRSVHGFTSQQVLHSIADGAGTTTLVQGCIPMLEASRIMV
jgi:hypothetical protein